MVLIVKFRLALVFKLIEVNGRIIQCHPKFEVIKDANLFPIAKVC